MHTAQPAITWFFGLPCSGKTTLARALAELLRSDGCSVSLLDGDDFRALHSSELGFSRADRSENLRRAAVAARNSVGAGNTVVAAFVTPFASQRDEIRQILQPFQVDFVWVSTPLEICMLRDTKGLYRRAVKGDLRDMTGIGSPFEPPLEPCPQLDTSLITVAAVPACVRELYLQKAIRK